MCLVGSHQCPAQSSIICIGNWYSGWNNGHINSCLHLLLAPSFLIKSASYWLKQMVVIILMLYLTPNKQNLQETILPIALWSLRYLREANTTVCTDSLKPTHTHGIFFCTHQKQQSLYIFVFFEIYRK